MKILRTEYLVSKGSFALSTDFKKITDDIVASIKSVVWPIGTNRFVIYPEKNGSGVKPIKDSCMQYLYGNGWKTEVHMKLLALAKPGPIDAVKETSVGYPFVLEWETGNISSSHRALNKIAVGMLEECVIGGCLIIPSRNLYKYLTDRIGNYKELEPYFPLWRSLDYHIKNGVLMVVEIEHDDISLNVSKIPKGTDGRALK